MPSVSDDLHGLNCKPCVAQLQLRDLPSSTSRVLLKVCATIGQNQLFSPSPTSCQDNWSQQWEHEQIDKPEHWFWHVGFKTLFCIVFYFMSSVLCFHLHMNSSFLEMWRCWEAYDVLNWKFGRESGSLVETLEHTFNPYVLETKAEADRSPWVGLPSEFRVSRGCKLRPCLERTPLPKSLIEWFYDRAVSIM